MKTSFLLLFVFSGLFLFAQTDVTFKINHKLANESFEFNKAGTNNLGNTFTISRLQYYISGFSIVHDGGQEMELKNIYLLADASNTLTATLGNYNVQHMEAIKFHIGIDSTTNHEDPSVYPSTHPLGLHDPTMHWGWAGGYRFIALEGKCTPANDKVVELHTVGDINYLTTTIPYVMDAQDGKLNVALNLDVARCLQDITLEGAVVVHGLNKQAKKLIENFKNYGFSALILGTENEPTISNLTIYPNPVTAGEMVVHLPNAVENGSYSLSLYNMIGLKMYTQVVQQGAKSVSIPTQGNVGTYYVVLTSNGKIIGHQSVVITP